MKLSLTLPLLISASSAVAVILRSPLCTDTVTLTSTLGTATILQTTLTTKYAAVSATTSAHEQDHVLKQAAAALDLDTKPRPTPYAGVPDALKPDYHTFYMVEGATVTVPTGTTLPTGLPDAALPECEMNPYDSYKCMSVCAKNGFNFSEGCAVGEYRVCICHWRQI